MISEQHIYQLYGKVGVHEMQQVRIRLLSNGFLAKMLFVLPFDTGDGRLPPCLTS